MDPLFVESLIAFLLTGLCFLFAATLHELAHFWAARWAGAPTSYEARQQIMDPISHVQRDQIGLIFAPVISYLGTGLMVGWAAAPLDPYWSQTHPKRAGLVALAGPVANLLIGLGSLVVIRFLVQAGVIPRDPVQDHIFILISVAWVMQHLILFLVNLIPVAPLDGGRTIALILPRSALRRALALTQHAGPMARFIAWGLMCAFLNFVPLSELVLVLMFA